MVVGGGRERESRDNQMVDAFDRAWESVSQEGMEMTNL